MDRMLGFEPSGVGSIPAGPANREINERKTNSSVHGYSKTICRT